MGFSKKMCMGWVIGDRYSKLSAIWVNGGALDLPDKSI